MCSNNNGITVIVPVYNCEKFVGKCIESVQQQTFKDWRLILVDDGTPDNAGAICDEYAKADNRIVVIHQQNGGPGKARNNGINHCNTRWFTFLDSDDVIEADFLENYHTHLKLEATIRRLVVPFHEHTEYRSPSKHIGYSPSIMISIRICSTICYLRPTVYRF